MLLLGSQGGILNGFIELFKGMIYLGQEEQWVVVVLEGIFEMNKTKLYFHIPTGDNQTSINWNCHVQDESDKSSIFSYHIDSGSSIHILPLQEKFVDFVEIPPHPIKGVNGP